MLEPIVIVAHMLPLSPYLCAYVFAQFNLVMSLVQLKMADLMTIPSLVMLGV